MPKQEQPGMERGSYRRLFLGGLGIGVILLLAIMAWPFVTDNFLGTPKGGAETSSTDTTVSRGAPAQQAAQSTVGKSDPAGVEDTSGGRARAIKESSQPLSLTDQQLTEIRTALKSTDAPKLDQANFEMMIGVSVPKQTSLKDIPPKITEVLNGYAGDQYTLVQDKLVIVDHNSGRIAAIVPGVN
jgi:hypothetical protein